MKQLILIAIITLKVLNAFGQGTFQNLNFEEALILPGTPEGKISSSLAIPAWSAFLDETFLSEISYQHSTLFRSDIMLFDRTSGLSVIDGEYSVSLSSEGIGNSSIRQTALVPDGIRFLTFKLNPRPSNLDPSDLRIHPTVRINGEKN